MPAISPNYEVLTCEKCHNVVMQIFTNATLIKEVFCKECLESD